MPEVALAFLPFSQGVQIGFFTVIISGGVWGGGQYCPHSIQGVIMFMTCNILIKLNLISKSIGGRRENDSGG